MAFVEIWSGYSPQRAWGDIVREFLEATTKAKAGDTAPLEGFINETLEQYWEAVVERADEHALSRRAEAYVHFSKDLPHEFYTQLTAEARVPQRVAGGEAYCWIKAPGARNEVLDCTVYAIFCTHMLGLHLSSTTVRLARGRRSPFPCGRWLCPAESGFEQGALRSRPRACV